MEIKLFFICWARYNRPRQDLTPSPPPHHLLLLVHHATAPVAPCHCCRCTTTCWPLPSHARTRSPPPNHAGCDQRCPSATAFSVCPGYLGPPPARPPRATSGRCTPTTLAPLLHRGVRPSSPDDAGSPPLSLCVAVLSNGGATSMLPPLPPC
jgi:hypothetical protein